MATSPYANPFEADQDWTKFLQDVWGLGDVVGRGYADSMEPGSGNPQYGYSAYTSTRSKNKTNNQRGWLGNQYNRYFGDYLQAAGTDPTLRGLDFLDQNQGQVAEDYSYTDPYTRGEQQSSYQPSMRLQR